MRKLFISSVFVLIFCVMTFAQKETNPSCPRFNVEGPKKTVFPEEPITLTATLGEEAEKFDLKYKWTVSNAVVIEGQESLVVKVLIIDVEKALTATFEIFGLPKECLNTGSVSIHLR